MPFHFSDSVFWGHFGKKRLIPKPVSSLLKDGTFPEMVLSPNFLHVVFNVLIFHFEQYSRHKQPGTNQNVTSP